MARRKVEKFTNHPDYDYKPIVDDVFNTNRYDITIIELKNNKFTGDDFDLTKHTPACMPNMVRPSGRPKPKDFWVYGRYNEGNS